MKRTLLALSLIVASSAVFAVGLDNSGKTPTAGTTLSICNGTAQAGPSAVYGTTNGTTLTGTTVFVQQSFVVQCSANTNLSIQEVSSTLAVVSAVSAKGDSVFVGNSNGGAVAPDSLTNNGKCSGTNNACSSSDVTKGITDAITMSSSSGS